MRPVRAAEAWIQELVTAHPDTRFVFLLGNHDCVDAYKQTLDTLSGTVSNLEWHEYWYRRNGTVFLHGDILQAGVTDAALAAYRSKWNRMHRRSPLSHALYWLFARSGLPVLFLRLVDRESTARRIRAYLRNEFGEQLGEVREVFFGHVHTAFSDFEHEGILFHNTGSATHGMRLSVLRFEL
jgi:UDP-2,3-diacylglucosamine pyrophosphatase LpxH